MGTEAGARDGPLVLLLSKKIEQKKSPALLTGRAFSMVD
jgi:hypothetical protein